MTDLDIRNHGVGRTIRRKYKIVSNGHRIGQGICLHKAAMLPDNEYRRGAQFDGDKARLKGWILRAWLAAGNQMPEPPDTCEVILKS